MFISVSIARIFPMTLRSFSLLFRPCSLLYLIREGLFRITFNTWHNAYLVFSNWRGFFCWLNYTVIFMMAKVISDFNLQIELRCSASRSNKDWKRMGDWAPVWYRSGLKNAVFDYSRFYEIKLFPNRSHCFYNTHVLVNNRN